MGKKRFIFLGAAGVVLLIVLGGLLFRQTRRESGGTGEKSGWSLPGGTQSLLPPEIDDPSLSAEERDARMAGIKQMHAELPGNLFLPVLPGDDGEKLLADRDRMLAEMEKVHLKVEKGDASREEKEKYTKFRIRLNQDKAAMLKFVSTRKLDGTTVPMPEHITLMIREIEEETAQLQKDFGR